MAIVIDATVSGENANSFVTLLEYQEFKERLSPAPSTATEDNENRALVTACDVLNDNVLDYKGEQASSTQALPFPRRYVVDPRAEGYPRSISYYDDDIVPEPIKRAQMLMAYAIETGEFVVNGTTAGAVASVTTDGVSITYAINTGKQRNPNALPEQAAKILQQFLKTPCTNRQ
jgi:hypothetical protein